MATDNNVEIAKLAADLVAQYMAQATDPTTPTEIMSLTKDMIAMLKGEDVGIAKLAAELVVQYMARATDPLTPNGITSLTKNMIATLKGEGVDISQPVAPRSEARPARSAAQPAEKAQDPAKSGSGRRRKAETAEPEDVEIKSHELPGRMPARDPVKDGPAVPIDQSWTDDHVICLEDGHKLKFLRRHLNTFYGMTVEQYREKWGLNEDHPVVAPSYTRHRKKMIERQQDGLQRGQEAARARGSSA